MPPPLAILLVEDEPDEARLVEIALKSTGIDHELTVAIDGEQTLDLLHGGGVDGGLALPDLVLLDVNLPGQSGDAVLGEIRATSALASLRVVVLTSATDRRSRARRLRDGADAVVEKPIGPDELAELVHSFAGQRP